MTTHARSTLVGAVFGLFVLLAIFVDVSRAGECGWCRGKPLPACRSWWVLEAGWNTRIHGSNVREDKKHFLGTANIGYMRNIEDRYALGATLYISGDDDAALVGLCARGRLWLSPQAAVDLDLGLLLVADDNKADPRVPGFIGRAAIGVGDWVALTAHYQVIRFENLSYITWDPLTQDPIDHFIPKGTQSAWYVGVRFGSYAALAFPVLLAVIYAAESN